MTNIQRSRVDASLGGKSATEIARQEGVSPQAVSECLARPAARKYFELAGQRLYTHQDLLAKMAENLVNCALSATKPVCSPSGIVQVPDYAVRASTTFRLLELLRFNSDEVAGSEQVIASEQVAEKTTTRELRTTRTVKRP